MRDIFQDPQWMPEMPLVFTSTFGQRARDTVTAITECQGRLDARPRMTSCRGAQPKRLICFQSQRHVCTQVISVRKPLAGVTFEA